MRGVVMQVGLRGGREFIGASEDSCRRLFSLSTDDFFVGSGSKPQMALVELTRHLHDHFPALAEQPIEVEATTVAEVVQALERVAPGIAFYVCDERGHLRTHVNVFIGDERIADRVHLTDRVDESSRVYILQALSGG